MPYGKTVYARDIQWSDSLVAVFVVVPRFVVSLVSSLSGALGREVNFCLPLVVDGLQRLPQSQSDESAVNFQACKSSNLLSGQIIGDKV